MRELTLEEMDLITGGADTVDGITVVADGGGDGGWDGWWDGGYDGGNDGGYDGGGNPDPEDLKPVNCADKHADLAANAEAATIKSLNYKSQEYESVVWKDASGTLHQTNIQPLGAGGGEQAFDLSSVGVPSYASVVGLVHNHPDYRIENGSVRPATPTEGSMMSQGDVSTMDFLAGHGADASQLRMYVLSGVDGQLYEYDYSSYSDKTQTLQARSDTIANHVSDPNNPDSDSKCAS